jgi:hypothetical protein
MRCNRGGIAIASQMTYPVTAATNSSMPNRKIPAPPIKK